MWCRYSMQVTKASCLWSWVYINCKPILLKFDHNFPLKSDHILLLTEAMLIYNVLLLASFCTRVFLNYLSVDFKHWVWHMRWFCFMIRCSMKWYFITQVATFYTATVGVKVLKIVFWSSVSCGGGLPAFNASISAAKSSCSCKKHQSRQKLSRCCSDPAINQAFTDRFYILNNTLRSRNNSWSVLHTAW